MVTQAKPLFELGRTVITPGAMQELEKAGRSPAELLRRHVVGDWGDLSNGDLAANDEALQNGDRIFSAYILPGRVKFWVITESDRSSTCILLPSEY